MYSSSRPRARGSLAAERSSAWDPRVLEPSFPLDLDPEPEALDALADQPETEEPVPVEPPQPELDLQAEVDNAYQRGYDDGRAEGIAVEASRIGTALKALDQVVEGFENARPTWLEAAEKNLVALATAVAREVIGRELKGSADDITELVRRAIAEFPLEAAVRVRLNPADLSAISSPLRGDVLQTGREVRWIPDPGVAPGGCMVEGPEAIVDGRVEKALERIYTQLIYG